MAVYDGSDSPERFCASSHSVGGLPSGLNAREDGKPRAMGRSRFERLRRPSEITETRQGLLYQRAENVSRFYSYKVVFVFVVLVDRDV